MGGKDMQKERCIPIKKRLVEYMRKWFSEFLFEGGTSQLYVFRRGNPDGIYDYIIVQREFFEGTISLVITEVASCYNKSWKGIPWFTIGYGTDIGVLITGKNSFNADTGWHRCKNDPEELQKIFDGIREDIDTYVLDYFEKCHEKIHTVKYKAITNSYMQTQFSILSPEDIQTMKDYLIRVNKAFSEYRRACRKNNERETTPYFDIIPLHPILEHWITDIQKQLNYSYLSENIRTQLIKDTTVLFRDNYDFYDLR